MPKKLFDLNWKETDRAKGRRGGAGIQSRWEGEVCRGRGGGGGEPSKRGTLIAGCRVLAGWAAELPRRMLQKQRERERELQIRWFLVSFQRPSIHLCTAAETAREHGICGITLRKDAWGGTALRKLCPDEDHLLWEEEEEAASPEEINQGKGPKTSGKVQLGDLWDTFEIKSLLFLPAATGRLTGMALVCVLCSYRCCILNNRNLKWCFLEKYWTTACM